jgi:hypothetical protein
MKKRCLFLFLAVLISFCAAAQESKPVISLTPFIAEDIDLDELRLIETLIQSYLSDFGEVIDTFIRPPGPGSQDVLDFPRRVPDYIFSGDIYSERDNRIFTLKLDITATGETVSHILVHKNTSELILKARSLVEAVFSPGYAPAAEGEITEKPETLNEGIITGIWRGDPGIEMIRLQRSGRGVAIFSSGVRMDLAYFIDDNTLKIHQVSQNIERFYHPLPYEVAKQLSAEAEPISWELALYENGSSLRGIKRSTGVRYEGVTVLEILPGTVREVTWMKSAR